MIDGVRVCMGLNTKWYAVLSPVIAKLDNYPASHSWIELDYHGQTFCYESVWPQGRRIKKEEHAKTYKTTKIFELPKYEAPLKITHFLEEQKHKKYSFLQIVLIGIGLASKPFDNFWNGKGVNSTKYLICTELCAMFLNRFYGVSFNQSYDMIGLRELDQALKTVAKEVL